MQPGTNAAGIKPPCDIILVSVCVCDEQGRKKGIEAQLYNYNPKYKPSYQCLIKIQLVIRDGKSSGQDSRSLIVLVKY
jgi:hypothetical protein